MTQQGYDARATFTELGFSPTTNVGMFDEVFNEKTRSRVLFAKKGEQGFYVEQCKRIYFLELDEPKPKKFVRDRQNLLDVLLERADRSSAGKAQCEGICCERFGTYEQDVVHSA